MAQNDRQELKRAKGKISYQCFYIGTFGLLGQAGIEFFQVFNWWHTKSDEKKKLNLSPASKKEN